MAYTSNITIQTQFGTFKATYFNNVIKQNTKITVKAPNGKEVTERVIEEGYLEEDKNLKKLKESKATTLTKQWMDEDGVVYTRDQLSYFDSDGNSVTENVKTEIFKGTETIDLIDALNKYSFDTYYTITPTDPDNPEISKVAEGLTNKVTIGEFSTISKGFTKSWGALRYVDNGIFEIMSFKNKKTC